MKSWQFLPSLLVIGLASVPKVSLAEADQPKATIMEEVPVESIGAE